MGCMKVILCLQQKLIELISEATSALDNENEASVIKAIENLSNEMTIIMIAHRLNTLKYCNRVIKLSSGSITVSSESNII